MTLFLIIVITHFGESALTVSLNIFIYAVMFIYAWAAAPGAIAPSAPLRYATAGFR